MHKSLWLSFMCILSSQLLVLCKADSTSHVILVDGNRYVVKLPSERHFCKAAASCADFGHHVGVASYLIGRHYKSVAQKLRDAGKCAWTSLSQLLVSAALPPLIWLDGDLSESRLFVYAQTQWWISKKNATLYPIAVLFYESKLLDSISITSSDSLDVLCEYRNTGLPPSLFIHKFSQKVPQVLESFMVEKDKTAGCLSSGKSRTMLACVWRLVIYKLLISCRFFIFFNLYSQPAKTWRNTEATGKGLTLEGTGQWFEVLKQEICTSQCEDYQCHIAVDWMKFDFTRHDGISCEKGPMHFMNWTIKRCNYRVFLCS